MKIRQILVSFEVQKKIFKKHNVKRTEIEGVFFDEPYFFKTRSNRYVAIGLVRRYITVVFNYKEGTAVVVTAYEASKWQKKVYKEKR
tara:strand:- start:412 stop:672 length:261 start_codon:yes stop_codon:yes gene_type:complete